jgi:uncharacterized repeat protein (TIGR03806 family)
MRRILSLVVIAAVACGDDDSAEPTPVQHDAAVSDAGGKPHPGPGETGEPLDDLGLFADAVAQEPAAGVIPYDVNAVLYADGTEKLRFLQVPEGRAAEYDASKVWAFPDGTRLVKTFYVPNDARDPSLGRRLIETRIIERTDGKWTGRTYVWNDAQSEALRLKTGKRVPLHWIDAQGEAHDVEYRVPNDNECKTCHSQKHVFEPLGPRTRQLSREHDYGSEDEPEREDQIDHLAALGVVQGEIQPAAERFALADPYGDADVETRARAYLDANCSHCHRPGGEAGTTALDLRAEISEPFELGVCRTPVSAGPGSGGHDFDIVAGDPDASILVYRMASSDPEIKMPELPTVTSDADGTALIRAWIAAMPPESCN